MKAMLATGAVALMTGILIGWIAKPDSKPEEQAKDPATSRTISALGSGASTGSGAGNPGSAKSGQKPEAAGHFGMGELDVGTSSLDDEIMREDPMDKIFSDRQKKTHENLLADLARKLNLNEEQKGHLAKVLDGRMEEIRRKMKKGKEEKGEFQMKEIGALIRGEGMRESIAVFLSDKQLSAYDSHKKEEWSRQVESRAYKDLAQINSILELNEAQKDQVYEILYEDAGTKMEANRDVQAFMGMLSGQMGVGIDVGDDGVADMMELTVMLESEGDLDENEIMRQMQERRTTRNAEKIDRMKPILDDQQLERYREHLESPTPLLQQMLLGVESEP